MTVVFNRPAPIYERFHLNLTGPTGPEPGVTGPAGAIGPSASIGPTGHRGPKGGYHTGPTGPTGPTSTIGYPGPTGPVGDQSIVGPTGFQGDYGPDGPTGNTGVTGFTGNQGPLGGAPRGVTGGTGVTGHGSYSALITPFYGDTENFLTPLLSGLGNHQDDPWTFAGIGGGVIVLLLVAVAWPRTFTEIVIESQSQGINGVQLGIYDCNDKLHPTVPLFDSGLIIPVPQGRISASMSVLLQAKPYYLAFASTGSLAFRAARLAYEMPLLGMAKYAPRWNSNTWAFANSSVLVWRGNTSWNTGTAFLDLSAEGLGDQQPIGQYSQWAYLMGIR